MNDAFGCSSARSTAASLTEREACITHHLTQGLSNKEIANTLDCSVKTIEFHVSNILRKFGVSSRTQLLAQMLGPTPR